MKKEINWNIKFNGRAESIASLTSSPLYKRVYYFQDNDDFRIFFVVCDKSDLSELLKLKSLNIILEKSKSRFKISCIDSDFNDTFETIFLEIFTLMEDGESIFEVAYNKIIKRYSTFLRKQLLLSKEEQIGLLGELIVLKEILCIDNKKISYWSDKNEDFVIKNSYIEVKSTRSKEHKHIINGLAQLTIIPETQKYLSSNLVTDEGKFKSEESVNLYDLTNSIISIIDISSKDDLIERLLKRSYAHKIHGEMYIDFNFRFYEKKIIQIIDNFPCLNLNTLDQQLYSNIDPNKIKYELNLENMKSSFFVFDSDFLKNLML